MTWELYNHINAPSCQYEDAFSDEEIEKIIDIGEKIELTDAKVYPAGVTNKDDIRKNKISWIISNKESEWLYRKLTDFILNANGVYFKYDLNHIENLQYTVYNEGDFFAKHVDHSLLGPGKYSRKLSFSLQLTDSEEYVGGEVKLIESVEPRSIIRNKGSITFFPSYTLHEVLPVTKGIRKSLVGWVHGPGWK